MVESSGAQNEGGAEEKTSSMKSSAAWVFVRMERWGQGPTV